MKQKFFSALVLSLFALLLSGIALYGGCRHLLFTALDEEALGLKFSISKGDNLKQIAHQLSEKELIRSVFVFEIYARLRGLEDQLQSGEYSLTAAMSSDQILMRLVNGEVIRYKITVPEGKRFADFWQQLRQHPNIISALANPAALAQELGLSDVSQLEGQFLPETFSFIAGTQDRQIFTQSYQLMQRYVNQQWQQFGKQSFLNSPQEVLVLASIIEKETGLLAEQPRIAGVFLNRLQRGMRLQTDPTVIYGLGDEYQGDITYEHLRRDTPYNTYTRFGLPPTPIALPGRHAIDAVLQPQRHQELYFVSRGDGSHVFSKSYQQHQEAVNEHQLKRR